MVLSNRDDADPWALLADIVKLLDKEHVPAPLQVAGPQAEDVARELFAAMQSGQVDCTRLGEDFNVFLTPCTSRSPRPRRGSTPSFTGASTGRFSSS